MLRKTSLVMTPFKTKIAGFEREPLLLLTKSDLLWYTHGLLTIVVRLMGQGSVEVREAVTMPHVVGVPHVCRHFTSAAIGAGAPVSLTKSIECQRKSN